MISAQVDELRELATRCDELQVGAVKAVTMPSDMGSILRDAADTIWQLRDDLQRANAENVKLREERDHWHVEQVHAFGNWEDSYKRAVELEAENTKLRKLVGHLYYVKPRDVTSILVNGEALDFDELMAEVGLRWEDA